MSNLVEHAKRELGLMGNGPMIDDHLIKMIEIFAGAGHSGSSAEYSTQMLERLLRFQNIKPLTDTPEEWTDHSESTGSPFWQSDRNSEAFSTDGGKTYTLLSERGQNLTHNSVKAVN